MQPTIHNNAFGSSIHPLLFYERTDGTDGNPLLAAADRGGIDLINVFSKNPWMSPHAAAMQVYMQGKAVAQEQVSELLPCATVNGASLADK